MSFSAISLLEHSQLQQDNKVLRAWIFFTDEKLLANVNSGSRLLYTAARPSVVCLSVTLVRHTEPVEIFHNVSTSFGKLAIRWHPQKFFYGDRPRGTPPSGGGLNVKGVTKYSDFEPIEGYISETVQDRK